MVRMRLRDSRFSVNIKRNINKEKQDMLEQIEELKNEVTNLKLELKSKVELNVKRRFDKDKQGQKQIEGLKKEVTDLKSKLHKTEQDMLKQIKESLKEELNVKRNFNIDKQDMLEQIEELKLELKSLMKTNEYVELFGKVKSRYFNFRA